MKHLALKDHTDRCNNGKSAYNFCNHNPETFLFFYQNEFVLITYYRCLSEMEHHLDFKENLLKQINDKYQKKDTYDIDRVWVDRDFREYRLRGIQLEEYIDEVNYIYSDATMKMRCLTTRRDYLETIKNQENFEKGYQDCKKYLIKNEYKGLLSELEDLYRYNHIGGYDKVEIVKTQTLLIKQIRKEIRIKKNNLCQ